MPVDSEIYDTDTLLFDCQKKASGWEIPSFFVFDPKSEKGNFYFLKPGVLVFDSVAYDQLAMFFEMAGEILPLEVEECGTLFALNVRDCVNALDKEKTVWRTAGEGGPKLWIETFVFHPDRFTSSSIFKIPETSKVDILTYTGFGDDEDEFKPAYEASGLMGLVFEELWSSDEVCGG
jgi:hypothetical protein